MIFARRRTARQLRTAGSTRIARGWGRCLAAAALAATALGPSHGLAQQGSALGEPRLVDVRVEPSEPSFGRAFQLHVTLRIPLGTVAFLPDTLLPADAMESVAPGRWNVGPALADSVEVRATYPVMGFREGRSNLPALEVWVWEDGAPARSAEAAVRRLAELGGDAGGLARPHLLRLGTANVAPLLPAGDTAASAALRPAADVVGGVWNGWILLAAGLGTASLIALIWLIRVWRSGGPGPTRIFGDPIVPPRKEALQELDRIREAGWHKNGRTVDFYRSSTEALRRFAVRTEPAWGTALTSNELVGRIEARWGVAEARALAGAVAVAEEVKFGARRPDERSAESDWKVIRDWIEHLPEGA